MRRVALAFIIAFLTVAVVLVPAVPADAGGDRVLVDYGDGRTDWYSGDCSGSCLDVIRSFVGDVTDDPLTVSGVSVRETVGETSVSCSWRIYSWDGGWVPMGTDFRMECPSGTVAFGFYPEGFAPAVTPERPHAWTQYGGDSASSGRSVSYGLTEPSMPVEWYNSYTTGFVDSGLMVAGDLLYHTTGGTYQGTGTDGNPWLYCIDRFTGDIVWEYMSEIEAGYEVTTPIIVGGFLVVSFTTGDLTVFDRFTGEVKDTVRFAFEPPLDQNGDIAWEGRTFVTGATTPVYDSGALYFGLADGRVCCYALSPEGELSEVWCHVPETGKRGCFYFHSPVMADVHGVRTLFIGSYEGYVHALDASDGSVIWERQAIDISDNNPLAPNAPGSAATVTVTPDGSTVLVGCTDSSMIPAYGYTLFMDARTGEPLREPDGSEKRMECLMTKPVVGDGCFYSFVTPMGHGETVFRSAADGSEIAGRNAVYCFDWNGDVLWQSKDYPLFKGQMTLADGILYAMDYSAGSFWPNGGGATAIDADDGSEVWRVHLRPCTDHSFSMVSATVIEGKVYVANDIGAVYCISDTPGAGTEEEWVETLQTVGFRHWSWAALVIVSLVACLVAYRLY